MVEISVLADDAIDDRETTAAVARSAFPTLQASLIEETPHMLAARHEGSIVGGTINEVFEAGGATVGLVTWIFTREDARGLRAGEALLEETVEYLETQGCDVIVAIVEWANTSSSKLFGSHGFTRTSAGTVASEYGLGGAAGIWWHAMYWPALGYDLWTLGLEAPSAETRTRTRSAGRFLEAVGVNVGLFALAALTLSLYGVLEWSLTAVIPAIAAILGIRYLPQFLATMGDGRSWQFWSWGSVTPFAAVFAAVGWYLPVPGNRAPRSDVWTYRETLPRLGPAAAVSAGGLVGLYGLAHAHESVPWLPADVATVVLAVGWFVVVVDVVVPSFPFDTYNARVVQEWSRPVWAVLAAVGIVLLGMTGWDLLAAVLG